MPRRKTYDESRVNELLRRQERIATHAQLTATGMPLSTVTRWIAPAGRWQRVLPGVVVAHNGTITRRQCRLGALAYSGPDAMLSGLSGLRMHRLRAAERPGDEVVHTLVPHDVAGQPISSPSLSARVTYPGLV